MIGEERVSPAETFVSKTLIHDFAHKYFVQANQITHLRKYAKEKLYSQSLHNGLFICENNPSFMHA